MELEMKIELHKEYRTRDGGKAIVSFIAGEIGYGLVVYPNNENSGVKYTSWDKVSEGKFCSNGNLSARDIVDEWREPVKYSRDVYFQKHPFEGDSEIDLQEYLFGEIRTWSDVKTKLADKKYRVTVEEIVE